MALPRISIVTVSLNQAGTIEAALRSVFAQGNDLAEYIVIDGGSSDGTREVIAEDADRLTYWVSEPDRGQSHALNKGFARASGDVLGWLNGDDVLLPGALRAVREEFARDDCDVLCGACRYEYPDGSAVVRGVSEGELRQLPIYDPIHQPSCFWRRELHERAGGLDENWHYGMDWELWMRFRRLGARFKVTDRVLSVYRVGQTNKTTVGGERRNREMFEILSRHNAGDTLLLNRVGYRLLWPLKRMRSRRPAWLFRTVSDAARTTCLMALGPMFGFDRVRRCTHPFS